MDYNANLSVLPLKLLPKHSFTGEWQLRLVKSGRGGDNCLQFSTSVTSSRVAIGQSTTMGAGPKLTRLIDIVIESMSVVSIVASCHSHVDIIVVMAAPTRRHGVDVLSQGKLIMIQGVLLSLNDWAISANLGGHAGFLSTGLSGGADTCAKIVFQLGMVGWR